MSARVFVSHRPGDAMGLATALADELDAMFGDGQVVRIAADAASAERWREALAGTLGGTPILVALVTPEPPAGEGTPADAALRAQIDAAIAAGALILPLLGDGAADAPGADLPAPFKRLSHLPRQPLRSGEWTRDIARLGEELRGLGLRPLAGTQPGTMPLPLRDEGPITMPLGGAEDESAEETLADGGRRRRFGVLALGLIVVGGWGAWRWRQRRPTSLSGIWRAQIGLRGAPSSREGGVMRVTVTQKDRSVGLASTVGIETDPQWEEVRRAWKGRTGKELKQVIYRGQGELVDEEENAPKTADAASAALPPAAGGTRRVAMTIYIAAPGASGEKVDEGRFRGEVDAGDQRIRGRLWLESEQAERVFDLWRDD